MALRLSYVEEDIEVKPSPELIPDEYEHFRESGSKIAVHTFSEDCREASVSQFCETLKRSGLEVEEDNKHSLKTDDYNDVLDKIRLIDADDTDGLIILFRGTSNVDGELTMFDGGKVRDVNMEKIWSKFYSYNCKGLKNKPKIFIFVVSPSTSVQVDSIRITHEMTYDTPAEADMLTIYNKSDNYECENFIENFCENIKEYGQHEDIIGLVTCVVSQYMRPLVISTLTRKFYFTASDARGHHLTIQNYRSAVLEQLTAIKDILESNITRSKDKPSKEKNKKTSFFDSFRLGRKREKREDKIETPKQNSTVNAADPETQSDGSKCNQAIPSTSRRPARNRLPSQSGSDIVANNRRPSEKDKKPAWRP